MRQALPYLRGQCLDLRSGLADVAAGAGHVGQHLRAARRRTGVQAPERERRNADRAGHQQRRRHGSRDMLHGVRGGPRRGCHGRQRGYGDGYAGRSHRVAQTS